VESGPARHHTLRAALDWSYDALTDAERRVFVGVSVFAGDFTLDAAEAVCADAASDVIDTLSRLVDKSLVLLTDRTRREGRYRLLETMRQYGGQMLIDIGRDVGVRRRQLQWAAALSEAAEQGLDGPEQARWLQALDAEHDNLRGALDWATTCPTDEHGPRTAAALWRYWEIRGFLGEGRARLEAEAAAMTAELAAAPAAVVIANHVVGLFQLGAIHLNEDPPHLDDGRLAIDAVKGILDAVGDRLGDDGEALRTGLTQLQLAYVELHRRGGADGAPGVPPG